MSQHFQMGEWLSNPSDREMVAKSKTRARILGEHISGPSLVSKIEALVSVQLVCKNGHGTTLGAAQDNGRCALPTCKHKLMTMEQYETRKDADVDDDDDQDDSKAKYADLTGMLSSGTGLPSRKPVTGGRKNAQKSEDTIPISGNLDGEQLRTAKSRPRSGLWTGIR